MRWIGYRAGIAALGLVAIAGCDLEIVKSAPESVAVNVPFQYTITVTNKPREGGGSCARENVQVTDVLPAGVALQSYTASQGSCAELNGTVTCALGTLEADASATIELVVRAAQVGTIVNTASVTADDCFDNPDPNPDNDSSSATTRIVAIGAPVLSGWGFALVAACLGALALRRLRIARAS